MTEPTVAVIGDNCLDCYQGDVQTAYPGGNAVNVSVYLRRLGIRSAYYGIVGDDAAGHYLRDALAAEGVEVQGVQVVPGPTGRTWVRVTRGERHFEGDDPGVQAPFRLSAVTVQAIRSCRLASFSGFSSWGNPVRCQPQLAEEVQAVAGGPQIALDCSDTPAGERQLRHMGAYLDYAFFSRPACSDEVVQRFIATCTRLTSGLVIVTRGALGCAVGQRARRTCWHPAPPVTPVDTLGAGDAFIAGFLAAIIKTDDIEMAVAGGTEMAAAVIAQPGAWQNAMTMRHSHTPDCQSSR